MSPLPVSPAPDRALQAAPSVIARYLDSRARLEASRAELEDVAPELLSALRDEGETRYGSVTAFAEAIAEDLGVKVASAWNGLYKSKSSTVVDAAIRLLGYQPESQAAAAA